MKLGFFKPEAIAAGIVWFVIIVLVSPFFGYEYVRQDNYVTVQRYEELQSEAEYLEEENDRLKETNDIYNDAIIELQDRLESNQVVVVREIKDEDFLYLIDNYYSLHSRLDYINGELCSIQSDLEYAKTQNDRSDIHYEIEKLRKEIEFDYDEYGDILSEYL